MFSHPTSKPFSVVCTVRIFPKWVFSSSVSYLRICVFDFN